MGQIGNYMYELAFHVAPLLDSIDPHGARIMAGYGFVVFRVILFHERASRTLAILRVIGVVADVDLEILKKLILFT